MQPCTCRPNFIDCSQHVLLYVRVLIGDLLSWLHKVLGGPLHCCCQHMAFLRPTLLFGRWPFLVNECRDLLRKETLFQHHNIIQRSFSKKIEKHVKQQVLKQFVKNSHTEIINFVPNKCIIRRIWKLHTCVTNGSSVFSTDFVRISKFLGSHFMFSVPIV